MCLTHNRAEAMKNCVNESNFVHRGTRIKRKRNFPTKMDENMGSYANYDGVGITTHSICSVVKHCCLCRS